MIRYALSRCSRDRALLPAYEVLELDFCELSSFRLQNIADSDGLQIYCQLKQRLYLLLSDKVTDPNTSNPVHKFIDALRNRDLLFLDAVKKKKTEELGKEHGQDQQQNGAIIEECYSKQEEEAPTKTSKCPDISPAVYTDVEL